MNRIKRKFLAPVAIFLLLALHDFSSAGQPIVLMFIVDGLQSDAVKIAMANGALNFKYLYDNGVWVKEAYCTSPSPDLILPDGSLPWGESSPPNVAMHTGTHVFESRQMDDIFLSARRSGIKSVFAGGAVNYKEFNTADYSYCSNTDPDSVFVQQGIDHFKNDAVQLIRLHIQRIRNYWLGPDDKIKPKSPYQQYLLYVDHLLGKLINVFKENGVWDSTYIIVAGDHGMGMSQESEHPASIISSWKPYINFYGPTVKRGKTIPYAESPDIAIMVNYFLNLQPLVGHISSSVTMKHKGTTGTLLTNILVGYPDKLSHPMYIRRYLESVRWKPSDNYAEYRKAMLSYIK